MNSDKSAGFFEKSKDLALKTVNYFPVFGAISEKGWKKQVDRGLCETFMLAGMTVSMMIDVFGAQNGHGSHHEPMQSDDATTATKMALFIVLGAGVGNIAYAGCKQTVMTMHSLWNKKYNPVSTPGKLETVIIDKDAYDIYQAIPE